MRDDPGCHYGAYTASGAPSEGKPGEHKNLEVFLYLQATDDQYYQGINQRLTICSSNDLAYIDNGYKIILKI